MFNFMSSFMQFVYCNFYTHSTHLYYAIHKSFSYTFKKFLVTVLLNYFDNFTPGWFVTVVCFTPLG